MLGPQRELSKLPSEIASLTTKAKYISLSQSLRDLIPLKKILQELSDVGQIIAQEANTYSTVFEDNKGCVDLIVVPTIHPRMRNIAIRNGHIHIKLISTNDQLAGMFTMTLPLIMIIYSVPFSHCYIKIVLLK